MTMFWQVEETAPIVVVPLFASEMKKEKLILTLLNKK